MSTSHHVSFRVSSHHLIIYLWRVLDFSDNGADVITLQCSLTFIMTVNVNMPILPSLPPSSSSYNFPQNGTPMMMGSLCAESGFATDLTDRMAESNPPKFAVKLIHQSTHHPPTLQSWTKNPRGNLQSKSFRSPLGRTGPSFIMCTFYFPALSSTSI
jgi:hypothetical protein